MSGLPLSLLPAATVQEWTVYRGDQAGPNYFTLDQIIRANMSQLRLAWEWKPAEKPLPEFKTTRVIFEATPLVIGGVLYLSTSHHRGIALNHPALAGAILPDRLGAAGVIVTKGGLSFVGGGDRALPAVDKATGNDLWSASLAERSTATPMTYLASDGKQYVVIASGAGPNATLSAFSLP